MSIELDVKIIKYVQKFPYLYYKGAMNYNNELLLASTWTKLGKDLKVSPDYCMNRWKYLRRRFTREPKFALPEKEWVLLKYLRFLEPFINRRKPVEKLPEAPPIPEFVWGESQAEWENKSHSDVSSASTPAARPSWKQSNDSFCQSLSNTLQTLTPDQQVSCRIDILVAIEKYLSSISVGDGSNSTNSTASSFHQRPDTLASDVSKRFAEILEKISSKSISPFDESWMIIFAVKNFFCKLLEMRKMNPELDVMLPALVSAHPAPQVVPECRKQVASAPRTTAELKKPVCMSRKSELSKVSDNQFSSVSNPSLAVSAESKTDAVKPEGAASTKFSQNKQHLPESNQNPIQPNPTWNSMHQFGVHNPVQSCFNLNPPQAATYVEPLPMKTENSRTQLGSSGLSAQNPHAVLKNSNCTLPKLHLLPPQIPKVAKTHVPNFLSRCPAKRSAEFENAVHNVLKSINSTDPSHGFIQDGHQFVCVLCDVWLASELFKQAHTCSATHKNLTTDYFLHCSRVKKTALPKLDKSLYVFQNGKLLCLKCKAVIGSRSAFVGHMTCKRHISQVEHVPTMIGSIDEVIVSIGTGSYCVLCNVKLFDSPPAEHILSFKHQREIALWNGIFKIDRDAYCSYCNEKFPQATLSLHVNNAKHASKIFASNSSNSSIQVS